MEDAPLLPCGGPLRLAAADRPQRVAACAGPRPAALEDVAEPVARDEAVEGLPERLDVAVALRELSPLDRRLVGLRYGADMTQPEIAELLGIPEGTVKVRLHRARRALADGMETR
jgi:RNA polymerase sigma factor (sigma-70 family)